VAADTHTDDFQIKIVPCRSDGDWQAAKGLTNQYARWLAIDLSFQDFQSEMAHFEQEYGPPKGCYLLAKVGNRLAGGVGLRYLAENICEMKRLFVLDEFKEQGIGQRLCETLMNKAHILGYKKMRLDTLGRLEQANRLYKKLGFYDISAYRENPEDDVRYMEYVIQ
jgi:carbonic anhydrase